MAELAELRRSRNDFRRYGSIFRMGKDEVDGILNGTVHVTEKLDGANASIWYDPDKDIVRIGSRSQEVTGLGFRGLEAWANLHATAIKKLLNAFPEGSVLHGEWLVKHTINYPKNIFGHFYLFDIWDFEKGGFAPTILALESAKTLGIPVVPLFATLQNPTEEEIASYVGRTEMGAMPHGEGIVLRNDLFVNRFGRDVRAKIVSAKFKEINKVEFAAADLESTIAEKYVTDGRLEKIFQKMVDEGHADIKRTAEFIGRVQHDVVTEEAWDIARAYKSRPIVFSKVFRTIAKMASTYYTQKAA